MSILTSLEDHVVVSGMDPDEYRRHPALSYSGAKLLLPPNCPALFKHYRDHGRPNKPVFDFGHAAHALVLGVGEPIRVIDADDWRTKAAKEERELAYSAGCVPLLRDEWATVEAMAAAVLAHPIASVLFASGKAEQSLFWHDERTGLELRSRLDWITELGDDANGRPIGVDFKTTVSASPGTIAKTVANFGYHMQAAFYLDAMRANGYDDPGFLFVFQEKTAPYLVTVVELDEDALRAGRDRNQIAIDIYAECVATDTWPGYATDIELVRLPVWATREAS